MRLFRQLIHGRVDRADHQRLKDEAAARGISLSRCVGDIIREYFALRTEMLSVTNSHGVPGEGHPGLVHSLVARMEERLGTRADARANELAEGQRRLEIMLDRLVTVYLVHTWEVPPELQASALASANRRYRNYWRVVNDRLTGKRRSDTEEESSQRADKEAS
jgi:hypothetical protein